MMIHKCAVAIFSCVLTLTCLALTCPSVSAEEAKSTAKKSAETTEKTSSETKSTGKTSADNKAKIKVAYKLSRKVMTIDDLEKIVDTLESLDLAALSKKDTAYADSLLGWAWNAKGKRLLDDVRRLQRIEKADSANETLTEARSSFDASIAKDATRASSFQLRGVVLAMQDEFDAAIVDFDRAIRLNADHTQTWFNRAETFYAIGQYASAVDDYAHVLEAEADDIQALTGRGHSYLKLGQFDDAIADYRAVTKTRKDDARSLTNLADAYLETEKWTLAEATYKSALEVSTGNERTYRQVAWLYATCPDKDLLKPQIAFQCIKKAIELSGNEGLENLKVLAAVHAANGDFEIAGRTQERAIELAGDQADESMKQALERFASKQPVVHGENQRR